MSIELPPLSFAQDALEPYMSARTLEFHHDKHHRGYVDALNALIVNTDLDGQFLNDIILATANNPLKTALFNNAAQVWNHTFFWQSLKPNGGGKPSKDCAALIDRSFGSYDKFHEDFCQAAVKQFGSGWVWLIKDQDKLSIITTANANTPFASGKKALIVCDVWEHAYYLDFQNRRMDYVKTYLDHLINWEFAESNLTNVLL